MCRLKPSVLTAAKTLFHSVLICLKVSVFILTLGCGMPPGVQSEHSGENSASLFDTLVDDNPIFVTLRQPFEDLDREEQVLAFHWARKHIIEQIRITPIGRNTGVSRIIQDVGAADISATLATIESEFEAYFPKIQPEPKNLNIFKPTGFIPLFLEIPASASTRIGLSGAISLYFVSKVFKATKIDKRTGDIAAEYWEFDYAVMASVRAGGGFGSRSGTGMHVGFGFIWEPLASARSFQGFSVQGAFVPVEGWGQSFGMVGVFGGLYDSVAHVSKRPRNFYGLIGVERGLQKKSFEAHVQIGGIAEVWGFIAKLIDLGGLKGGHVEDAELRSAASTLY